MFIYILKLVLSFATCVHFSVFLTTKFYCLFRFAVCFYKRIDCALLHTDCMRDSTILPICISSFFSLLFCCNVALFASFFYTIDISRLCDHWTFSYYIKCNIHRYVVTLISIFYVSCLWFLEIWLVVSVCGRTCGWISQWTMTRFDSLNWCDSLQCTLHLRVLSFCYVGDK